MVQLRYNFSMNFAHNAPHFCWLHRRHNCHYSHYSHCTHKFRQVTKKSFCSAIAHTSSGDVRRCCRWCAAAGEACCRWSAALLLQSALMLPAKPAADEAPRHRFSPRPTDLGEDHHHRGPPPSTTDARKATSDYHWFLTAGSEAARQIGGCGWIGGGRLDRSREVGGSDTEVQGLGRKSNGRRMAHGVICETNRVLAGV